MDSFLMETEERIFLNKHFEKFLSNLPDITNQTIFPIQLSIK